MNEKRDRMRWVGCPVEADYFGEERKSGKAARKIAEAKDRSKYKKTDQRQLAKQQKEQKVEQALSERLLRGRVLSIVPQGIIVEVEGIQILCTLRGVLKKEKTHVKNLITVGDFVLCEKTSSEEGIIHSVEPRRTLLSRAENLSRRKEQLIAANIEQVIITASVVSPALKPSLIDRYIIATLKGNMQPLIVINKTDLLEASLTEEVEKEKERYANLLEAYKKVDIPLISVSTITGEGVKVLKNAMANKASVFSGQSGVGKSSLINAVTEGRLQLRVGNLVEKTNKGTHTTTTAQLIPLDFGGWCIDTPGIKSFGVWDLDREEVEQYFSEIFTFGHQCHFPDCSHLHEEGCSVKKAVEKGEISVLRYESYLTLMESASEPHFKR